MPPNGWRRCGRTHSILDSVQQEAARLQRSLGASDRTKVDEYLEAVREVEQRIQRAERQTGELTIDLPGRPTDIPESFEEHAKLMFDLQVLAYQADITRVTSLLVGREQSGALVPEHRDRRAAPLDFPSPRRSRC